MVNRLSASLAKVISVKTSFQNLVDKDLTNCVSETNVVDAAIGKEPAITVRDMNHYYAAGTTAGFVVQMDQNKLLGLNLAGLPFKIFFYYKGEFQESMTCDQQKGKVLSLDLINVSGGNATFEVTAKSTKPFDEVGICATKGVSVDLLSTISLYYAFVGNNGKFFLTSSATNSPFNSSTDTSSNGIKAFKNATNFSSDLTLGEWPGNLTAMIDGRSDNSNHIIIGGNLSVYALADDGSMPFKAGMRAGIEATTYSLAEVLSVSTIHLYQYIPNGRTDHLGVKHDVWNDVTPSGSTNFQLLSVDLGFDRKNKSVTADSDFNAIGLTYAGVNVGWIDAYRAFVELEPEIVDDVEPLVVSADRSLCDDKQSVTLHSDVAVKWTCSDTHGSTLSYSTTDYATECTVSGITYAGTYVFKATAADGRTTTTSVTNGISRLHDLAMKPWVNNFTEKGVSYSSNMKAYREKYKIFSADLLPLTGTKDSVNIVTPSLDDYATYVAGVQIANDKMIAGVSRSVADTLKEKTIVGFVVRTKWSAADVDLLDGLSVTLYDGGKKISENISTANKNFKVLGATVISGNTTAETEYCVEVDASESNPVPLDAITLWNKGLLQLGISDFQVICAFTETADDASKYQKRLDATGEMVSHYTTGARIDESLMNGGSGVDVAQTCENLANIVDGQADTYMNFVAPVTVLKFVPIPIKLGRRYDAGHQVKLIYSAEKALRVNVGKAINMVTYLNGEKQETKDNFQIVDANVIGGSDKSEVVWTPTKDFDEISIHLAGVANVADNYKVYGIRIENDADYDGIADSEDDESCINPFLVDENETTLEKSHDFIQGRMNLRRYMNPVRTDSEGKPSQWFNICLPVDLTFNQFVSTFGNNAELAKPDNFDGNPRILRFTAPHAYGDNVLLHAGVPYIIKITETTKLTTVDDALQSELMANNVDITDDNIDNRVYKVKGVDLLKMNDSDRNNKIQSITCTHPNDDRTVNGNAYWLGAYTKGQKITGNFWMFNKGVFTNISNDVEDVRGLRSWMREVDGPSSSAKSFCVSVNGDMISDDVTGIHQINADKNDNRMYNLQGMRVDNKNGNLPAGIYIINSKKVIIK